MLLLGAFQGVLFAVLLMAINRRRIYINRFLSLLLLVFGLHLFHQFLIESGYIHFIKFAIGFTFPLEILPGPALYWYIRSITRPDLDNSNKQVLIHFSILIMAIVVVTPIWLLDFDTKMALIQGGYSSNNWKGLLSYSMPLVIFIFTAVYGVYLGYSIKMLLQHKKRIKNLFSYQEKIALTWLTNLLRISFYFLLLMIVLIFVLDDVNLSKQIIRWVMLSAIPIVFYLGIMGLQQPRIYNSSDYSEKRKSTKKVCINCATEKPFEKSTMDLASDDSSRTKYEKSALTLDDMVRITGKLSLLMSEKNVFLESDLTMPILANHLTISANYLSQTLNEHLNESFFDYINRHRIDYAKARLMDENPKKKNILDIAFKSAFNSKSAFYSAFKKHTGMTPSQYIKSKE